jgi:feruloyl esterase
MAQNGSSMGYSLVLVFSAAIAPAVLQARPCESLLTLASPTVSIVSAATIATGTVAVTVGSPALTALPPFCRVAAQLRPTEDSDIGAEIWLPLHQWNGKFLAVGSGGWGGSFAYDAMADALRRGYATSATDDGHRSSGAAFIVGHREKFIDFAYRAEHEMTVEAKTLIEAFYGRRARYSYWSGCSGGGREGLLQAYRYPQEFDGIIAGDPANVRRNAWALWLAVQALKDPDAYIPAEKYPLIHRAVLDACDAADGLKDGLIEQPQKCNVDFKTLECNAAGSRDCLTARQVKTAQTLISPATTHDGRVVFPRLEPGTELRWGRLIGGPAPADLFLDQFRYVVYQDPQWDWRSFDLERDFEKANAADKDIDELDPHLAAFAQHGGKLIIYHGWADQQVAPGSSVDFYNSLRRLNPNPAATSNWARLFMVPGMGHCGGGEGPDTFDTTTLIERWVERGHAPQRIIASHVTAGKVDRTRPLCPYPEVARYDGRGSIDEASHFTCRSPD